ncbi:MAG: hypothetical protein HC933_12905 [Pleurocapsa sp. SU_196_0]|nr:hypothetical protein [Pleurocapsa sp. SU_196_0]
MPDEQTFEMLWDCPACGTQKLLARSQRHCPNCGSPQEPAWRYFPAEDDAVVVENYTYVGADVICPNCETPNSQAANFCVNCAAPLKGGAAVTPLASQSRAEGETFAQEDLKARRRAQKEAARGVKPSAVGRRGVPAWAWVLGLIAVFAVAVWAYSLTRDEVVTVSGHAWQREIKIERFQPVSGSAWCDSLPFGAYNVSSFSAVRDYRQIPDGQTCRTIRSDNGDGTFRHTYVGTTDTDYTGPLDDPQCTSDDIAYVLRALNANVDASDHRPAVREPQGRQPRVDGRDDRGSPDRARLLPQRLPRRRGGVIWR